jgi:hypothetical protein
MVAIVGVCLVVVQSACDDEAEVDIVGQVGGGEGSRANIRRGFKGCRSQLNTSNRIDVCEHKTSVS